MRIIGLLLILLGLASCKVKEELENIQIGPGPQDERFEEELIEG